MAHLLNRLSGESGVHQASVLDGLSFDPFAFQDDGVASAEVNIGWRQVADGLVVTLVVVVLDEGVDLGLEIARQVVVFEQNAVLQRLVPALDLAWSRPSSRCKFGWRLRWPSVRPPWVEVSPRQHRSTAV